MLKQNVPLKEFSNYKIGGNALYFLDAKTEDDLEIGIKEWQAVRQTVPSDQQRVFVWAVGQIFIFRRRF